MNFVGINLAFKTNDEQVMHVHNDTSGSEQHTKPHIFILIEIRPIEPWRSIDRPERH
jgi:hypothetical protein